MINYQHPLDDIDRKLLSDRGFPPFASVCAAVVGYTIEPHSGIDGIATMYVLHLLHDCQAAAELAAFEWNHAGLPDITQAETEWLLCNECHRKAVAFSYWIASTYAATAMRASMALGTPFSARREDLHEEFDLLAGELSAALSYQSRVNLEGPRGAWWADYFASLEPLRAARRSELRAKSAQFYDDADQRYVLIGDPRRRISSSLGTGRALVMCDWAAAGDRWALVRVPAKLTDELLREVGVHVLGPTVSPEQEPELIVTLSTLLAMEGEWQPSSPGDTRFKSLLDTAREVCATNYK